MPNVQFVYWILTIPAHCFVPYLPPDVIWIKGQLEKGSETGYLHWQIVCAFKKKVTLKAVRNTFGPYNSEPSRSAAANEYVHKEDTAIPNTRFELGVRAFKRNDQKDWIKTKALAKEGRLDEIEPDIFVRYYHSLARISKDYMSVPPRGIQNVRVYWGVSGSGKSHMAHEEAGDSYYSKAPLTKWWDGYKGEQNIIIDEFRGKIDVTHLLKWFDKYPCTGEVKGGAVPLQTCNWWITSNLSPEQWYEDLDNETVLALRRRLTMVIHFSNKFIHKYLPV